MMWPRGLRVTVEGPVRVIGSQGASTRNTVKATLAQGGASVGTWMMSGHPAVAEILARAGLDWVVLDVEHGTMDWPKGLGLIQAVQGQECAAIFRLPVNAPEHFWWALDLGAEGVMVPMVQTAAEAEMVVAYAKYPPQGMRGVGVCRAHGYGAEFQAYVETANDETLVVPQIEHIEAVEKIEAICAVPGVDAVLLASMICRVRWA